MWKLNVESRKCELGLANKEINNITYDNALIDILESQIHFLIVLLMIPKCLMWQEVEMEIKYV